MLNNSRFSINLALNAFNITLNTELSAIEHRDLVNDSRLINKGDIFAATLGHVSDGRDYIENAINAGAELIIVQCDNIKEHGKIEIIKSTTLVQFFELNNHLSRLAYLYYQQPHNKLTTIGITGTNGKTTISQIIAQLIDCCGKSCAVIGTAGAGKLNALTPVINTTPGPTELNKLLNEFVNNDITHVAMEVSSHALEQHRVAPEHINVAVFTNISRDHLDYHHTMENYAKAKEKLFTKKSSQIAILNGDDHCAHNWLKSWNTDSTMIIYGLHSDITKNKHYAHANNIKLTSTGAEFDLVTHQGAVSVKSILMGNFNISNLLAAAAVLLSQGFSLEQISQAISQLKPIIGRMEMFSAPDLPKSVIDYAHTPDALENALKACKEHCNGNLHVVFGCGGDRDKGKRPLMGAIAEQYADFVVLTNDNPRHESPETIAHDILLGCKQPAKVNVILTREKAVITTIETSAANDIILFAGKGHEDYIVIGNKKMAYNERKLVQSIYAHKAVS